MTTRSCGPGSASVTINDVKPSVTLTKQAVPPTVLLEPGGILTFTLTITTTSPADSVTITALTDTGTLSVACQALIGTQLAIGETKSCTTTVVHTTAGSYNNIAAVTVQDDEGNTASAKSDPP